MKRSLFLVFLLIALGAKSQGKEDTFCKQKTLLMNSLDTTCVFTMKAAESPVDDYNPYQQDGDFLYLTGIEEPGYMLIMIPGGIMLGDSRKSCLFFFPAGPEDKKITPTPGDTIFSTQISTGC